MIGTRTSTFTSRGKGLFNRDAGPLQSQLYLGEYDLLRLAPMLESDFVQISKRGELIDVHNQVQTVTVGVACASSVHLIPNMLILARSIIPRKDSHPKLKSLLHHQPSPRRFELTRLLPLRFVKMSIHNLDKKQLRFKLASGRAFYLQLCSQPGQQEDIFPLWVNVVQMLRPPTEEPPALPEAIKDIRESVETPVSKTQNLAQFKEEEKEEKVSIQSLYVAADEPNAELTTKQSVALSFDRPHSTQPLVLYPTITEERSSDLISSPMSVSDDLGLEDPLFLPLPTIQRSDISIKEVESEEIITSRRRSSKSRRRSRSKPQKPPPKKPSKLLSFITSCIWGTQRKRSRGRKSGNRS